MLECPQDRTNRSRPGQCASPGLCRITFWNSRYATGAKLIAVPGWPLPTFWTASAARMRMVSTARESRSDHPSGTVAWSEARVSVTAGGPSRETNQFMGGTAELQGTAQSGAYRGGLGHIQGSTLHRRLFTLLCRPGRLDVIVGSYLLRWR